MREAAFQRAIADAASAAPHARFGVYRNNVTATLINALRVRYPVAEKLLGPLAFAKIAKEFAATHPPRSPVLIDYGDNYPDFLSANSSLPYLGDLARLESLWWRAYHAADAPPLAPERFNLAPAELETARFRFHPSAAILASRWSIGEIWKHGRGAREIARPETILVWRTHADVQLNVIEVETAAFLTALMQGKPIVEAIGPGANFDLEAQFRMLIAAELVTALA